jgi:hypothetical protein
MWGLKYWAEPVSLFNECVCCQMYTVKLCICLIPVDFNSAALNHVRSSH